ncbi:hypothetical protein PINS_up010130 [Pythium insidiosum]|nr:hypothetical protein PINS_up010130 [Pythium insidiosum]
MGNCLHEPTLLRWVVSESSLSASHLFRWGSSALQGASSIIAVTRAMPKPRAPVFQRAHYFSSRREKQAKQKGSMFKRHHVFCHHVISADILDQRLLATARWMHGHFHSTIHDANHIHPVGSTASRYRGSIAVVVLLNGAGAAVPIAR